MFKDSDSLNEMTGSSSEMELIEALKFAGPLFLMLGFRFRGWLRPSCTVRALFVAFDRFGVLPDSSVFRATRHVVRDRILLTLSLARSRPSLVMRRRCSMLVSPPFMCDIASRFICNIS